MEEMEPWAQAPGISSWQRAAQNRSKYLGLAMAIFIAELAFLKQSAYLIDAGKSLFPAIFTVG
jgi:hypothetical protein